MSGDDDITDRLLSGDAHDEAVLTVRRAFRLSGDQRILLAVGVLLYATLLWPGLVLGRDTMATLEPTALQGGESPVLVTLVAFGLLSTVAPAVLLVGIQYSYVARSLDVDEARRLIRIEDFVTYFLLQGALFIVVPTTLVLVGSVVPGVAETLYGYNVRIYRPGETLSLDAGPVSATGGGLGLALAALRFFVSRELVTGNSD